MVLAYQISESQVRSVHSLERKSCTIRCSHGLRSSVDKLLADVKTLPLIPSDEILSSRQNTTITTVKYSFTPR
jgi:hypothetical protein